MDPARKPALDADFEPIRAREDFLIFGAPFIGEAEVEEIVHSVRSGWLGTGPKVQRFEELFAKYKGTEFEFVLGIEAIPYQREAAETEEMLSAILTKAQQEWVNAQRMVNGVRLKKRLVRPAGATMVGFGGGHGGVSAASGGGRGHTA